MSDPLDDAQREHVSRIRRTASKLIEAKYIKGVIEHGGYLWENDPRTLLDMAIDEAVDQVVYLLTIREQVGEPDKPRREPGTPPDCICGHPFSGHAPENPRECEQEDCDCEAYAYIPDEAGGEPWD